MTNIDAVLKPYTSHKKVRAAEITSVGSLVDGARSCPVTLGGVLTVELEAAMFARYVPVVGDYLVVYENGYKSFSPRKDFVEGYNADDLNALELGAEARRSGIAGESFSDIRRGLKIKSGQAGTNTGDGVALTSAAHPGDPFKGQEN